MLKMVTWYSLDMVSLSITKKILWYKYEQMIVSHSNTIVLWNLKVLKFMYSSIYMELKGILVPMALFGLF